MQQGGPYDGAGGALGPGSFVPQSAQAYTHHKFEAENAHHYEVNQNYGNGSSDSLAVLSRVSLRLGFLLQIGALLLGIALTAAKRFQLFNFDIYAIPEDLRHDASHAYTVAALQVVWLLGALSLTTYQALLPDNSTWSRGFRTGSRLFAAASTLDVISSALRAAELFYAATFAASRVWLRHTQSTADWCGYFSGTLLQTVSLALYASGIFALENYCPREDEAAKQAATVAFAAYCLSAAAVVCQTLFGLGTVGTLVQLAALGAAFSWAVSFEPALNRFAPRLDQTDLNKALEGQ